MRRFKHPPAVLLVGLALALSTLLIACGVTETGGGGAPPGAIPTTGSTVIINGTPGTVTRIPTLSASPSVSTGTPDTSGKVTLVLNQSSYAPGSTAIVTIGNGLSSTIAVADHHSSCTYIVLQHLVAGIWQPVGLCKLMTPIRLVELAAGSFTPQKIFIQTGPQAAGTYQAMLQYNGTTVVSVTFTVS
jgi:hypothetical protein